MDFDKIYSILGNPGRYHLGVFVLLSLHYTTVVMNHLAMAIYGVQVNFQCSNISDSSSTNQNIVKHKEYCEMQKNIFKSTDMYTNDSVNEGNAINITHCHHWQYAIADGEKFLRAEFDLVCEKSYIINLSTTLYFVGVMLGGLVFGTVSDRKGRKFTILITMYSYIVLGVALSFVPHMILFIILRFFIGFVLQGLQTSSIVLIMELFPTRTRPIAVACVSIFWAFGVMFIAFIGYAVTNWRYIQLIITLPFLYSISYYWILPESPRLLVSQNRRGKFMKLIQTAAKFNRIELPANIFNDPNEQSVVAIQLNSPSDCDKQTDETTQLNTDEDGQHESLDNKSNGISKRQEQKPSLPQQYTVIDIFRIAVVRKYAFIFFLVWFTIMLTYYTLSLGVGGFVGNIYLNLFIGACVECVAYITAIFTIKYLPRKMLLFAYIQFSGLACIVISLLWIFSVGKDFQWLITVFAMASRFFISASVSLIQVYTGEVFATPIRAICMGACLFCARMGGVVAPVILLMADTLHRAIPFVFLALISVTVGVLSFVLLPETKGHQLPAIIDDMTKLRHKQKAESKVSNRA